MRNKVTPRSRGPPGQSVPWPASWNTGDWVRGTQRLSCLAESYCIKLHKDWTRNVSLTVRLSFCYSDMLLNRTLLFDILNGLFDSRL